MKSFDLWMIEKDGDAHEVAHDLTMNDLCERLEVSRQAIYDSLNKGVLIKGVYQVYEVMTDLQGNMLDDYMQLVDDMQLYGYCLLTLELKPMTSKTFTSIENVIMITNRDILDIIFDSYLD